VIDLITYTKVREVINLIEDKTDRDRLLTTLDDLTIEDVGTNGDYDDCANCIYIKYPLTKVFQVCGMSGRLYVNSDTVRCTDYTRR